MARITKPIFLDETGKDILKALNVIKAGTQYVKGEKGDPGQDYIITEGDYDNIANVSKIKVIEEITPTLEEATEKAENAVEIAKGANQAISFETYRAMITMFNDLNETVFKKGQNVYIATLNVPDLWISDIEDTSEEYIYVSDEDFVTSLNAGGVQVGYYVFSMLETQKVDLTNYVKSTDYATNSTPGIFRTGYGATVSTSTGAISAVNRTASQYLTDSNSYFISKGTLENIKFDYIKRALVDNTIELTDEEKLAIEEWLGLADTYLTMRNETPYQVTEDYNPAHKKYVDEKIISLTQEEYDRIENPKEDTLYIIKEG